MSFIRTLLGGVALMLVATVIGVAVNAARGDGVALIVKVPKASVAYGETSDDVGRIDLPAITDDRDLMAAEFAAGEVAKERVRGLLGSGKIILIDARSEHPYEEGHIPGAINVPYESFIDYWDYLQAEVPMDANIIVYCTSYDCDLGESLARELLLAGYENIIQYRGGWDEWSEAGFPTEGNAH